jgi:hypothetical protein
VEHLVAGLEHFVSDYGVVAVVVILTLEALGGLRARRGAPTAASRSIRHGLPGP